MSINCNYLVMFNNPRDLTQVTKVGSQMFPGKAKFFREAFEDATERPYGYLFLDSKPNVSKLLKAKTNVFPDEFPTIVYIE